MASSVHPIRHAPVRATFVDRADRSRKNENFRQTALSKRLRVSFADSTTLPRFPLDIEPADVNPYVSPATVSPASSADWASIRSPWTRRLIGVQVLVILVSLAFEASDHQTIVVSGPIFASVGLAIALFAVGSRDYLAAVFGLSALLFAILIVFLINYFSWGPPQGDGPITVMAYIYSAFALPLAIWLFHPRYWSHGTLATAESHHRNPVE